MKETAAERLERMKREKEQAGAAGGDNTKLVSQLTHESTVDPDYKEIATKLRERQNKEKKSKLAGTVKYTIYVDKDVAEAFQALCLNRGDQKRFATEALADFVRKKARELDI